VKTWIVDRSKFSHHTKLSLRISRTPKLPIQRELLLPSAPMFNKNLFPRRHANSEDGTTATLSKHAVIKDRATTPSGAASTVLPASEPSHPPDLDIVGHKLSFINVCNEASLQQQEATSENSDIQEEDAVIQAIEPSSLLPIDEAESVSLHDVKQGISHESDYDDLSVRLEDLSGSILENLPSSNSNSVLLELNLGTDEKIDLTLDNYGDTSPIQLEQDCDMHLNNDSDDDDDDFTLAPSLRRLAQCKSQNAILKSPLPSVDSMTVLSNDAIVITLPTSTSISIRQEHQEQNKTYFTRKFRWGMYLILAMVFVMKLSSFVFVDENMNSNHHFQRTVAFVLNQFSTVESIDSTMEIQPDSTSSLFNDWFLTLPSPSPSMKTENDFASTSTAKLDYPTKSPVVAHNDVEPIFRTSTNDVTMGNIPRGFGIDGYSKNPFMSIIYWSPSSMRLVRWTKGFVGILRFLLSAFRYFTWSIYMATLAVTGSVAMWLLMKFIAVISKRDVKSDVTSNTKANRFKVKCEAFAHPDVPIQRTVAHVPAGDRTHVKSMNASTICSFLQSCDKQLNRCGRRSRVAPTSELSRQLDFYNTSAYEGLSIEDLKLVAAFLDVSGSSGLSKHKINLIGAIIVEYESLLQKLTTADITKILKVLNATPKEVLKKSDMIKLAVESGF
jgi:hypothetical protein